MDYLKFDGCYSDPKTMSSGYPKMAKALNATKRPIVFSCSWPAYWNPKVDLSDMLLVCACDDEMPSLYVTQYYSQIIWLWQSIVIYGGIIMTSR